MRSRPASPGRIQALLNLAYDIDKPWTEYAACREVPSSLFFPEKGESSRPAKLVCRGCAVRDSCLEAVLANPERFGVWAGLSERERRALQGPVAA